jgi:Ca-activated chloride channel family protein
LKKQLFILPLIIFLSMNAVAQQERPLIRTGNKLYREKQYQESGTAYNKALGMAPENPVASYNLGNASFRTNRFEEAVNAYDASIGNSKKIPVKEKGYYNKGVAMMKQQKLQESIQAWKNALKLDPSDQEARENLQKALMEQKKQEEEQKQKEKEKEKEKDKKDQQQQNQKQKDQQPPKPQSNLTKKQVEQLLKALQQKEKEVQEKLQSRNSASGRQEKDW